MKIKPGFILRKVSGDTIVLPSEGISKMDMMLTLNETARFLWEKMSEETDEQELVKALTESYEVSADDAKKAVELFVARLKENNIIE